MEEKVEVGVRIRQLTDNEISDPHVKERWTVINNTIYHKREWGDLSTEGVSFGKD